MATVRVEIREEKMDLMSCLAIGGEYDMDSGTCRYKVRINENGDIEYLKKGD